ncbi:hypothetical protein K443DRAFT_474529 [Laccaria amethystina LaAM-08-1]|uniref:Uncharacterized protein n=1 Tax=Laccaria amethystina LaAM-08-1 TaxID=1095629 RepID=A0A0C9WN72_9AGAR|nr:hypothetical protein K443DRAFT_474529 [Laccaria amethystina LaAM-08-1]
MTTPTVSTLLPRQSYLVEETVRNLRHAREMSPMVFRMWRLLFEAKVRLILILPSQVPLIHLIFAQSGQAFKI